MDKEKDMIEELEVLEDSEDSSLDDKERRLEEIAIEMQELEIFLDQLEFSIIEDRKEEQLEQYSEAKQKYKDLAQERKQLRKKEKTAWDKVPVWMIIYGVLLLLLCFPLLSYQIWLSFANLLLETFDSGFEAFKANVSDFWYNAVFILVVYTMPLLLLFLSWIIDVYFVRKDFEKKVFRWIWIIQTLFTIGLAIWLYFNIIKGSL